MPKRRAPGEGSPYQRKSDGRWVAALKWGPRGAERKIVRYPQPNTRAAAVRLLAQMRRERDAGLSLDRSRQTLGAYLSRWIDVYAARDGVGWKQERNVRSLLANHVQKSRLVALPIREVGKTDIEDFLAGMARNNYSGQMRRHAYNTLALVFDSAMGDNLVLRNPVRLTEPPAIGAKKREPWTVEQTRAFLAAAGEDRFYAAYLLAIYPGPRQAEILGLTWDRLDLDGSTVVIDRQLVRRDGEYGLAPTKDRKSSIRALPPIVVAALREHRRKQLEERLRVGAPTDDGLVFVTEGGRREAGRPVNGTWLTHHFQKVVKAAKLPAIDFHTLRHVAGALDVAANTNLIVAMKQRGHASIASATRYSHAVDDDAIAAALAVEQVLVGLDELEEKAE